MLNMVGEIVEGKVTSITNFGAFVVFPDGKSGMIHISEVSDGFVKDINAFLKVGQSVRVKVCSVDEKGRIALSLKKAADKNEAVKAEEKRPMKEVEQKSVVPEEICPKEHSEDNFEDMMSRFMKTSNEKISDLKKTMDAKRSSPGFSRKNSKKY